MSEEIGTLAPPFFHFMTLASLPCACNAAQMPLLKAGLRRALAGDAAGGASPVEELLGAQ